MRTLTYWVAPHKRERPQLNARGQTLRECRERMAEGNTTNYLAPRKVSVRYRGGFDLLQRCVQDPYWEDAAISDAELEELEAGDEA